MVDQLDQVDGPIGLLEYTTVNGESFVVFNKETYFELENEVVLGEASSIGFVTAGGEAAVGGEAAATAEAAPGDDSSTGVVATGGEAAASGEVAAISEATNIDASDLSTENSSDSNHEDLFVEDKVEFESDVHEEDINLRAERRKYQRRKRRERIPNNPTEFSVSEVGPDLGFEETKIADKSLKEFGRIFDYRDEMLKSNLGSTCVVKVDDSDDSDGCFLKGVTKGQLLVVVAKDGNNQIVLISWAGLRATLMKLLPEVEHMMCARHILANWKKMERSSKKKPVLEIDQHDPELTNPHVEPPVVVSMPGRPKKRRNRQFYETKKCGKMSRKGVYMTCSICHGQNHNKRGCPFKDSVGSSILNVEPSDVPSTSRSRGSPRNTPPPTSDAPPRPRGRPRKISDSPDVPPRPRERPKKTTLAAPAGQAAPAANVEHIAAATRERGRATAREREKSVEHAAAAIRGRERSVEHAAAAARGRGMGIEHVEHIAATTRGSGRSVKHIAAAARGRKRDVEHAAASARRREMGVEHTAVAARGRKMGVEHAAAAAVAGRGRGRPRKIPLGDIGVARRTHLNEWFENQTSYALPNPPASLVYAPPNPFSSPVHTPPNPYASTGKRPKTVETGVLIVENGFTTYNNLWGFVTKMDSYILTFFHHGGTIISNPNLSYKGELDIFVDAIDKSHFSLIGFLFYTKDLGYSKVKGFYCQHIDGGGLVQITFDGQLLEFVKELKDGDELDVYVFHVIDEDVDIVKNVVPLLVGPHSNDEVDIGSDENENRSFKEDLNGDETDLSSSESDLIDIDKELRAFKDENRSKKKSKSIEEIPVGEAGIDKGFQDIGRNKKDRYVGRLGGDEEYIDSSECDSIDSTDLLDEDAVVGVDFPRRRRRILFGMDNETVPGELLVAVGKNGNNQIFPIAWVVMDKKTKHNWSFFINYLKEDLQLGTGAGLTVTADMQKGFHAVVLELLLNAEIRRYARHIWANWSQEWKEEESKK
ncbi:hypothetical protein FXO38_19048 [Capsicum annuum]|nr:hypothetical protein FXO38_19048 [Capsicum annuum]